jgi:hypothetical protein
MADSWVGNQTIYITVFCVISYEREAYNTRKYNSTGILYRLFLHLASGSAGLQLHVSSFLGLSHNII